jgi:hypothetical protein
MWSERLEQGAIDLGGTREHVAFLSIFRAAQRANSATGLLDEERAGCRIPRRQPEFPEGIHTSRGDIGQIESSGPRPSYPRGGFHRNLQHGEVRIHVTRVGTIWKTGRDQGSFEPALLTHAYTAVVEVCATASRGGEDLLAHGVVYYGVLQAPLLLAGDGDRENGELVQEVRRPIERVDDPHGLVVPCGTAFFGQESVVRVVLADDGDDLRLRLGIDLTHEVVTALGRDGERFQAVQIPDNDLASAARGADSDIEKRMHGKIARMTCCNEAA